MIGLVRSVAGKVVKPPAKFIDCTETCEVTTEPLLYIFTDADVMI